MNDVLKAIEERFSCRGYTGEPVSETDLKAIAKAALQAPSAMNLQPWRLIVVTNKALVDRLDAAAMAHMKTMPDQTMYNRIMERGGKVFYNAPVLYLILKDPVARWADVDAGIMTQNICLAAESLGLHNVIVAMANIPFNSPEGDELKKQVGWIEGFEFGMGVLVGHGSVTKEPHEIDWEKVKFI
ncbi:MAG: nitroreductase family protein [Defluviitaleaceae bacterium]|nr:nitroreductase family protein [Defluviitaleaceae bacterium]